jgi:hypothetical protein
MFAGKQSKCFATGGAGESTALLTIEGFPAKTGTILGCGLPLYTPSLTPNIIPLVATVMFVTLNCAHHEDHVGRNHVQIGGNRIIQPGHCGCDDVLVSLDRFRRRTRNCFCASKEVLESFTIALLI